MSDGVGDAVDLDGLSLALDALLADEDALELVLHLLVDAVVDGDLGGVVLGEPLEPRGEVHRVADDRVLHPLLGADVAGDRLAVADADADLDLDAALEPLARIELPQAAPHAARRAHRAHRIVGAADGATQARHDAV